MLMFMDNVSFEKESMMRGVKLISDAVKTTYGPNGQNVLIQTLGGVHITKDGMTVATYVTSDDPEAQVAIDVIKELSQKTAKDVGDGTTTCVVLANALVEAYKNGTSNPIETQRTLQKQCKQVVEFLQTKRKDTNGIDDIRKVATIAANNDEQLGSLIAEAYDKVGKYGVVNIEESSQCEDYYEVHEGLQLDSGFASPFFINTQDNTCELTNVLVHITQGKISGNDDILPLAEKALQQGKTLLIIATDMETFLQEALLKNSREHVLESCFVKMPHHGVYKDMFIEDIKRLLGTTMCCDKVIVTRDTTTFIGCHSDIDNTEYIKEIQHKLEAPELSEAETKIYSKRLANFLGGVCTIKVGGYSQTEIKEKKDRVEDAVCATRQALLTGTLPGGGVSLMRAADVLPLDEKFKQVLKTPITLLLENSNLEKVELSNTFDCGVNFKTGEVGNAYELGVIEPFSVTKTSLENAVNAATLILTSGCVLIKQ